MKKTTLTLLIGMALTLSGCCSWCLPEEAKTTAANNARLSDAFVELIEKGNTTRDSEQSFIRSCRRAWHAQNQALNDVPLPADVEQWAKENSE